jgi:Mn-dependent DtxR family transcriptional regulator
MELSHSTIRYLLGIYELSQGIACVRSADLARHICVTKASVVKMCANLVEQGLIVKEHYGAIELTQTGIIEANRAYTNVVILENLLIKQYGVSSQNAHADAVTCLCGLSDECSEKMIAFALQTGS